jgi:NAD(P)-dependent dehydrogenase (short-subunit alcohol dehydrogenase family)
MDLGIKGRRALVTGGGRGLGRSIASMLAAEGAHVAVVSRTAQDVESLVEEMGGEAAGHFGVAMDLNPDDGPRTLLDHLANDFGPVDIVVHNMGGTLDISDPYCSIADWRRIWRHNIEVALELNLELLPAMSERGWGRAVHISSIAGMENQGPVPYGAIKAALTAYTRSLELCTPQEVTGTPPLPTSRSTSVSISKTAWPYIGSDVLTKSAVS